MSKKRFITYLLLVLTMLAVFAMPVSAATKKMTVKVSAATTKKTKSLSINNKLKLKVKDGGKTVSATKAKYKSSKKRVATVNKKGIITPKKPGKTVITIKYKGKTAKLTVKVYRPVKSVSLNQSSITLAKGDSKKLKATVSPANATTKTVTWKSSNSSVATVNSSGKVTAVGKGTATITATSSQGGKKTGCSVTVTNGGAVNNSNNTSATNSNSVTIDGVVFDVDYSESKWSDGTSSIGITITANKSFDEAGVKLLLNNDKYQMRGDETRYANRNGYNLKKNIIYDVPNWELPIATVDFQLASNKIFIAITGSVKTGTFPIVVSYKNSELFKKEIVITGTRKDEIQKRETVKSLEKKVWTSDMSVPDKITVLANLIKEQYSYDEVDCKIGAEYLVYAARDLGCEAWYGFDWYLISGIATSYDEIRSYTSSTVPSGHTIAEFIYNREIYICGADGRK